MTYTHIFTRPRLAAGATTIALVALFATLSPFAIGSPAQSWHPDTHRIGQASTAPSGGAGSGCADVSLDGSLLAAGGPAELTVSFRTAVARLDGVPAYTVLHAACSSTSISFSLAGPDGADGSCLLHVAGSRASGDCRLPDRGEAGLSAILDRSERDLNSNDVAHGS